MAGVEDIYDGVINDVINGVREAFLDENVDVDVLQQLKTAWEAKVKASGAVVSDAAKNLPPPNIRQPPNRQSSGTIVASASSAVKPSTSGTGPSMLPQKVQEPPLRQNIILSQQPPVAQPVGASIGNGSGMQYIPTGSAGTSHLLSNTAAGLQLQQGFRIVGAQNPNVAQYIVQNLPGGGQNLVMIPANSAQQLNLVNLNQGQPTSQAAMRPQQPHIIAMKTEPNIHNNIGQFDGAGAILINKPPKSEDTKKEKHRSNVNRIPQLDGGPGMSDSSSEDEMDEEDEDPLRRYASLEDDKLDDGEVVEEDPLNSNDDQSDDEDLDTLFDAEHVVVCQFEKVHRARSKWKFTLKDGIMHLNGKDYVFQKCSGEAEW